MMDYDGIASQMLDLANKHEEGPAKVKCLELCAQFAVAGAIQGLAVVFRDKDFGPKPTQEIILPPGAL